MENGSVAAAKRHASKVGFLALSNAEDIMTEPTDSAPRSFGPELRKRRKAEGWSLEELHVRSGVSKTYIQTLETERQPKNNQKPRPSMEYVRMLARALHWNEEAAVGLAFQTFYASSSTDETNGTVLDRPRLRILYPNGVEEEVNSGRLYDLFFNLKQALDEK